MTRHTILVGCLAALALTACASSAPARTEGGTEQPPPPGSDTSAPPGTEPQVKPGAETQVTGVVVYRERIALTPDAVVQVQVVELTPEGSAGPLLGEQTLSNPGQVPIRFSVAIPQERVRPDTSYAVQARITDGGRVYTTPALVPVLTRGAPSSDVQVLVRPGS